MVTHDVTVNGFRVAVEIADTGDCMVRAWEDGIKQPVVLLDGNQARILMEHLQRHLPPSVSRVGGGRHG